jgi:hypothetical protein
LPGNPKRGGALPILEARRSQPREPKNEKIIETVADPIVVTIDSVEPAVEAVAVVVKAAPKKRAKVVKEYAPHEHFGSPLNICRICGEKYSYVQKPHGFGIGNK